MAVLAPDFCSKTDQLRFLLEYLDRPRLADGDRRWLQHVQAQSRLIRDTELERLNRGLVFDPPLGAAAGTP